jgi:hypothetical protein
MQREADPSNYSPQRSAARRAVAGKGADVVWRVERWIGGMRAQIENERVAGWSQNWYAERRGFESQADYGIAA